MASPQVAHQWILVALLAACCLRMIAPIFLGAAIQWTAAACFVAFQTSLLALMGLQLIIGQSEGFFKNERHTEKIPGPKHKRGFEIALGGGFLILVAGMAAALIAGGAQVMCRANLPGLLIATYYHYAAGAIANVRLNSVLIIIVLYFGFGQASTLQTIEWTSAACFVAFQASLTLICCLVFIVWPDALYKSSPHLKILLGGCRQGELFEAAVLSMMCGGYVGAVMAGGAQDMCILQLPGLLTCTYVHYLYGSTRDIVVNLIFVVILTYLGLVR